MQNLEMLMQREQLMEDIHCIIESNFGGVEYKKLTDHIIDDVICQLCDAVCKNFPINN